MPGTHRSYPSDLTKAAWRAPELLRRSSRLELVWRVEVPKHRKRHLWRCDLGEE